MILQIQMKQIQNAISYVKKYSNQKPAWVQHWTPIEVILIISFVYESYGFYSTLYATVAQVDVAISNWAVPNSSIRVQKITHFLPFHVLTDSDTEKKVNIF